MRKLIWVFFLVISNFITAQTPDYSKPGRHQVKILEFRDLYDHTRSDRNIPVKIHYPAEKGFYPVILMSHGAGGNWDTHYGIAQYLASYGYVVLCLEHIGSNTTILKKSLHFMQNINEMIHDINEAAGRPKDVSFAINQLEEWNKSNPVLKDQLDLQNIGLLGHSYGAYTTMVIAGIRPTLDESNGKNKSGKVLVSGLNDDRVKACVALSPQGANPPFFTTESFVTLKTPLLGISGTNDQLLGGYPPIDRYNSFSLWPENNGNHKFIWLQNAAHNDFSDNDGSGTKNFYSPNRKDVSKIVRAASLIFFDYHLKNDQNSITQLSDTGLKPYLSVVINGVEVRSK